MFVDGTDRATDRVWKFLSTNEEPYLPFQSGQNLVNSDENCLVFASDKSLYDRNCATLHNASIICETECKLAQIFNPNSYVYVCNRNGTRFGGWEFRSGGWGRWGTCFPQRSKCLFLNFPRNWARAPSRGRGHREGTIPKKTF